AWQPLPQGNRVAVLTNAGGPGIMAVDALEAAGMQLAPLTESTRSFLRQRVLPAASVENPVDILAGSGPATYALCLDALLADETVDAVVVISAPQDWFAPLSLAEVVGEVVSSPIGRRKPVLAAIMGLASTSDATQILHRRRVPNFAFPERLGSTLAAMWQRKQWLDARAQTDSPSADLPVNREQVWAALDYAGEWLPPDRAEQLLTAYGILLPGSGLAESAAEAVAVAERVGYPVVLKLAGVTHKSDVGGVILNLESGEAVEAAFARLTSGYPGAVQVQAMVRGKAELIVGVVRDPQFGPLVMAGMGGVQVELVGDTAFELAPLTYHQADALLDRTAAGRILAGYRGQPPADRESVIRVMTALAQIALDWPQVAEIEINPLIAQPDGAVAVDARVRLTQQHPSE
ncbi:MAG: acetate--CoA ligase family protein, partial [Anaerolineae bacterium]|nr:acetate--CoA ligase family protein [Anaerolineae bacterium]